MKFRTNEPRDKGAVTDSERQLCHGDYLPLDRILGAKQLESSDPAFCLDAAPTRPVSNKLEENVTGAVDYQR